MKKRLLASLIGIVMTISLAACSGSSKASTQTDAEVTDSEKTEAEAAEETPSEETAKEEVQEFTDLTSIIDSISKDVEDTSAKLQKEWETAEGNTDSYENYKNNKDEALGFFDFCENESESLYERISEKETAYFKLIVDSGAINEYKEWDEAMEDFYDKWDDAMEDYYDTWDDLYEDAYDHYDEIITTDSVSDYEEYGEVWPEMYDKYSKSWASMYEKYSNAWAEGYAAYSDVWAGFYAGEKDVDKLISDGKIAREEAANASTEEDASEEKASDPGESEEAEESVEAEETGGSEDSGDEIDPDFKAAMDGYEDFFDEYCEFMTKYAEADSTSQISMLGDYTELLTKYTETMEEMDNMDTDSLNDAELKYYIEVTTRIQEKLLKVSVDIGG